jgi:hypothetical protein
VNASYSIPGEVLRHSLDVSFVMQNINTVDNEFTQQESTDNQMNGLSAGYRLGFVETDWNIGINASANQNKMATGNDFTSSAGISLNKSFFQKKLRATFGFTAMSSHSGNTSNNVNTARLTLSYRFLKKHSVNFNTNYLHRITGTERDGKKIAGEWIGTLTYGFAF